jgi:hypothetical protein
VIDCDDPDVAIDVEDPDVAPDTTPPDVAEDTTPDVAEDTTPDVAPDVAEDTTLDVTPAEICNNDIDDDRDGDTDCDDPDCAEECVVDAIVDTGFFTVCPRQADVWRLTFGPGGGTLSFDTVSAATTSDPVALTVTSIDGVSKEISAGDDDFDCSFPRPATAAPAASLRKGHTTC